MLAAGQHTLIKQPDGDDLYKHCILVKLTDSSTKAIEEFLRNKNNTNVKPSITFRSDKSGEISFPIESNNANYKKFCFSLSGVKESNKDISAAFECIQFTNNKLKTIGTVEQKLTVQANDEVFQATKDKVNSVAEEEKKNSTIEIKHSGAIVNRNSLGPNPMNRNKPLIPKTSANVNIEIVKPRNPVLDRPLRERLIHLLALKSFNKAELFFKLGKDNPLSEKDKEQLDNLLQSVAVYNQKSLTYEISNDIMLNEVKDDWQFYSQNEKHFVKKNVNKVKEKIATANQGQSQSLSTSLTQKSIPSSSKTSAFSVPTALSNKSANTSTTFDLSFDEMNTSTDKNLLNINKKISPQKTEQFKPISSYNNSSAKRQSSQQPSSALLKKASDLLSSSTSSDEMSADDNSYNITNKKIEKEENSNGQRKHKIDFEYKERTQEIETNELRECQRKYRKITNTQQRQQYLQEYDQVYREYLDLHNYIDGLKEKFDKLKSDLSSISVKSSKEYVEKKHKVINDYVDKKSDPDYIKKRERYSQVYIKLKFLHELLKEDDES